MNQANQQFNNPEQAGEIQTQPEIKKPRTWLWVVLGVLVTIILVGWVILTYQKTIFEAEKLALEQKVLELQKQTQPDELDTTGWQTYRNEELGFEIKYPGDWEVTEWIAPYAPSPSPPETETKYYLIGPKEEIICGQYPNGVDIVKPTGLDIYESNVSYEDEKEYWDFALTGDFQDVTFNGFEGIKKIGDITQHIPPCSAAEEIIILFNRERAPLVLSTNSNEQEIIDQIISTFKFLD